MCERLPQNYIPIHYELFLHIVKDKYPVDASVTVTFQKNQDDDKVFLHISPNITINKITQNNYVLKFEVDNFKLKISRSSEPDQDISSYPIIINYSLMPNFEDTYLKKPRGFYVYHGSYLTKFELSYARQLLPCFDEPCIRSSYTVKIRIPSDLTGISNMPVQNLNTFDNEKEIIFLPTPAMCSYLLCICIGNFASIEGVTKFGIPVKFYAERGKENLFHDYLRVAIFSLEWLEEKLHVKYELPHLQLISYEGCKIGMENYGLITLCDYTAGTEFFRHSKVVMHEIAHQWFGDLVSIKWWDSVWLNEGFAQFYQFLILNDCDPDYRGRGVTHFVELDGFRCLRFFAQDKVCPNASELDFTQRTLKSVIYIKGGFILKMFRDIVGEELFFKVCTNWCNLFKHKCAEASDFISVASSTVNKDYSEFFNVWLRSVGFPALFVNQIISKDEPNKFVGITITQKSYSNSVFQFKLPIVYEKDGKIERKELFVKDKETKVDVEFDWIIVNDELYSLCVVVYTKEILESLLVAQSQNKLSQSNCQLISQSPIIVSPHFHVEKSVLDLVNQFEY